MRIRFPLQVTEIPMSVFFFWYIWQEASSLFPLHLGWDSDSMCWLFSHLLFKCFDKVNVKFCFPSQHLCHSLFSLKSLLSLLYPYCNTGSNRILQHSKNCRSNPPVGEGQICSWDNIHTLKPGNVGPFSKRAWDSFTALSNAYCYLHMNIKSIDPVFTL